MKSETPAVTVSSRSSLRRVPILVIAALIAWCPLQTRADTIALNFTHSASTDFITANGTDTLGWAFSLSAPVTVTQLGVWDQGGNGLVQNHQVTIWDSTGAVIEAQMTVPSGTGTSLMSGFRYVTLTTPVMLLAGNYTIGALFNPGSEEVAINAAAIATNSPVTYLASRLTAGNAFPTADDLSQSNSYFGPNFQFTTSVSVPDTGTTASLFGLSLMGLAFLRRKLC